MYITIEDDVIFENYFNLEEEHNKLKDYEKHKFLSEEESKNQLLNPKEGLTIGNLFYNLYSPYKHYKPRAIVPKNEKEELMLRIQELDFAINDLNLYLDLYPKEIEAFSLFKRYTLELNKLSKIYAEKYEALELSQDVGSSYTWYKKPWPWEVENV